MSSNPGIGFTLFAADYEGDADAVMALMLEALRSPSPDRFALEHIADMLDPAMKRTQFKLVIKRRKGNRRQAGEDWFKRVRIVGELYDDLCTSMTDKEAFAETVKRVAMPVRDGGLGVSEQTVRGYLHAHLKDLEAQREALETEQ